MTNPAAAQPSRVAPDPPPNTRHPLEQMPVAARIRVDSVPDWMAPAPGVLWVTTYQSRSRACHPHRSEYEPRDARLCWGQRRRRDPGLRWDGLRGGPRAPPGLG